MGLRLYGYVGKGREQDAEALRCEHAPFLRYLLIWTLDNGAI